MNSSKDFEHACTVEILEKLEGFSYQAALGILESVKKLIESDAIIQRSPYVDTYQRRNDADNRSKD